MTRYGCILEPSFKLDYTEVGGLGQHGMELVRTLVARLSRSV